MSESKRRKAEIEALKTRGPKEKKRLKLKLDRVSDVGVAHFKNAAARAVAEMHPAAQGLRNAGEVTDAANKGLIAQTLVHRVDTKVRTFAYLEQGRKPKPAPYPIFQAIGRELTPQEFADHVITLAQIAPKGFRQPSDKPKNWRSTSLVTEAAIAAGMTEKPTFERSERGQKQTEANQQTKARIVLDQLILKFPDRAYKARVDERLFNWFVARTIEIMESEIDKEWLAYFARKQIGKGVATKYLHATARARVIEQAHGEPLKEAA